jgi:alpha-L-fucosidase
MAKYRQYMRNQITELLTKYGKIDILWLRLFVP